MTSAIDETHDGTRRSWVSSAARHPQFPLQNLPFGIFSRGDGEQRGGVAIGDEIFDIKAAVAAGLFSGPAEQAAMAACGPTLNPLMALGRAPRAALRKRLWQLLADGSPERGNAEKLASSLLHRSADCKLHLPAAVGAYTDFYAGIQHAHNGGVRAKRNPPLLPNYKYVPVAYHSRASSVVPSGTTVRRPSGQIKLGAAEPIFAPCRQLDFELELGIWIGPGNDLGHPIPIDRARDHVVGLCMLNDWSARDVQNWETLPLGPFLAKNFSTTVSPWVVTAEALSPFQQSQPPRPDGDPRPLPYLWDDNDQQHGAFDVTIEAYIATEAMRAKGMPAQRVAVSNLKHLYWTIGQMVAHHTCGGCNLQPGDLFGSGTISSPDPAGFGSMRELSQDGAAPLVMPTGETRSYIQDGDEVVLRARAERDGFASIGFGDCSGRIIGSGIPAPVQA
jgi:fumarylacetoacetase